MKAVDLFAGWGGFTLGAEDAGVEVVWAANHWPLAVETHILNHPRVVHECQDLRQADWSRLPPYELLLASPACQGHSQASQPKRRLYHNAMRATAWSVVDCAEVTRPKALIVENVPDFQRWQLYPQWRSALEALGYVLTESLQRATWHDVPQRRERLFVVGTRGRAFEFNTTIIAREPAFGPCIEWDAPGWRPVTGTTDVAKARIAKGRANHGDRFLSQHVTGHPGVSLDEPIRTITCKDQWIVVNGDVYRPLTLREYARAQSFPDSFRWPKATRADVVRGIGNAVPRLMARNIVAEVAEVASSYAGAA
jgi:DNA (cytosine-5)-methyltransferase 1